jgi:outer membrane lipopolysaccharide assembly protein LptE/RlpB
MAKVMRIVALISLISCVGSVLFACGGWQLRGVGEDTIVGDEVYLRVSSAPLIQSALIKELRDRGAKIADSASDAEFVITIDGERFDRRLLSVDPNTGKVREIELRVQTQFGVRDKEGTLLIPRQPVSFRLDYVFDEFSILGTKEVDRTVRRDLASMVATALSLRLEAVVGVEKRGVGKGIEQPKPMDP